MIIIYVNTKKTIYFLKLFELLLDFLHESPQSNFYIPSTLIKR